MLLIFGFTLSVVFIILGISLYHNAKNIIIPLTIEQCKEVAEARSDEIGNLLYVYSREIFAFSQLDVYRTGNIENIKTGIVSLGKKANKDFFLIFFVDQAGTTYDSRGKSAHVSDRDYFIAVMQSDTESFISHPWISRTTGEKVIYITNAVYNQNNVKIGIMAASLRLERLSEIIEHINIDNYGYGWIADDAGLMVAHPNQDFQMKFNLFHSEDYGFSNDTMLDILYKEKSGTGSILDPDGKKMITAFSSIPNSPDWKLGVTVPEKQLMEKANQLLASSLVIIVIATGLLLLMIYFVSDYISRPMRNLSAKMAEVAEGNLDVKLELKSNDEIGLANRSFDDMVEKLKESRETIRKHTENLEHTIDERTSELKKSNDELREAIAEVKSLTGLIPICAWCKKVRDDDGFWKQVEAYIVNHSDARITHGMCPECQDAAKAELEKMKDNGSLVS
jgi:methyl-accepting chemotaxis protein